jgi:uncharacterized protein YcbX
VAPAGHLAAIRRHPVKSVGWEALESVALAAGAALPLDRRWAVAHGRSRFDAAAPAWVEPNQFLRVTHSPRLAQVRAAWADDRLTLTHPDAPALTVDPETEGDALAAWAGALASEMQPGPYRIARADMALTDADEPWVAIGSLASLRALGQRMGRELDPNRFRANLWLEGLAPWEERGWVDREIAIGAARLRVTEIIVRCAATEASPDDGTRDAPVVAGLRDACGAPEFAVYAEVLEGGAIALGDAVST